MCLERRKVVDDEELGVEIGGGSRDDSKLTGSSDMGFEFGFKIRWALESWLPPLDSVQVVLPQ